MAAEPRRHGIQCFRLGVGGGAAAPGRHLEAMIGVVDDVKSRALAEALRVAGRGWTEERFTRRQRWSGLISLIAWLAGLTAGRLIAYW